MPWQLVLPGMENSYLLPAVCDNGVFKDTVFYLCTKKKRLYSTLTYPNCDKESFSIQPKQGVRSFRRIHKSLTHLLCLSLEE